MGGSPSLNIQIGQILSARRACFALLAFLDFSEALFEDECLQSAIDKGNFRQRFHCLNCRDPRDLGLRGHLGEGNFDISLIIRLEPNKRRNVIPLAGLLIISSFVGPTVFDLLTHDHAVRRTAGFVEAHVFQLT